MSLIKELENRGLAIARVASEDKSLIHRISDNEAIFNNVKLLGNHFGCERLEDDIPVRGCIGFVELHGTYKDKFFMVKLEGPVHDRSWIVYVELMDGNIDGEDGYGEKQVISSNPLKFTDFIRCAEKLIKSRYDYIDDEDQQ